MKHAPWIGLSLGMLALSSAAVAIRVYGYPGFMPWKVAQAFDWFVGPGTTLWWLMIAGVFQPFPSTLAGYCIVVLGNTALWLVAAWLLMLAGASAYRLLERRRR